MSTPSSPSPTTQVVSISLESSLQCAAQQLQSGLLSVTELDTSVKEKASRFNASTGGFDQTYNAELDRLSASLSPLLIPLRAKLELCFFVQMLLPSLPHQASMYPLICEPRPRHSPKNYFAYISRQMSMPKSFVVLLPWLIVGYALGVTLQR